MHTKILKLFYSFIQSSLRTNHFGVSVSSMIERTVCVAQVHFLIHHVAHETTERDYCSTVYDRKTARLWELSVQLTQSPDETNKSAKN